jgi:predicted Zn-dependent protease
MISKISINLPVIMISAFVLTLMPFSLMGSSEKESKVGREAVALYLGAAPLVKDLKTLKYVNSLGLYLLQFVPPEERIREWTFGVIETESVNAFTTPGGYVLITQGLLNLTETEDQLAFILSHEISHVIKEHHLKVIQKQETMLRVVERMQGNMDSSNTLFEELNDIYRDFAIKGLDKKAEHEADLDGTLLVTRAGFNSYSGHEVLFLLSEFYKQGNETGLFFKTHPHPLARIDLLNKMLPDYLEDFAHNSEASSAFRALKL